MKKSIGIQKEEITHKPTEIELNPVFEVTTPPPDMQPIADAIKSLMLLPRPDTIVHVIEKEEKEKKKTVKIEVERDSRGFIKSLTCTEL